MAQQTAMTELLQWVRDTLPMDLDYPIMIEKKIESLIEIEKEQIQDAWMDGNAYKASPVEKSEQYYNKTYNNGNSNTNI